MPVDRNYVLQLRPEDKQTPEMPKMSRDIMPKEALEMIAQQGAKIAKLLGFLQLHDHLVDAADERARKATHVAARLGATLKREREQSRDWYQRLLDTRTHELTRQNELLRELIKHTTFADRDTEAIYTVKKPYAMWASVYDVVIEENNREVTLRLIAKKAQEMHDDSKID